MKPDYEKVSALLAHNFPDFAKFKKLEELSSGYINHVWRVVFDNHSVIIKFALDQARLLPELALPKDRIFFEAEAMELLNSPARFEAVLSDSCRPPRLLAMSREQHALLVEDVGINRLSFEEAALKGLAHISDRAGELGAFIAMLHLQTADNHDLAKAFNNIGIQQARYTSQYCNVENICAKHHSPDAEKLGAAARKTGQVFLQPGRCLTMGDLWPRSLLVGINDLRIIDWEFAHFGNPAQDVGHFIAHLWLLKHYFLSIEKDQNATILNDCLEKFVFAYRRKAPGFLSVQEICNASVHFGAEILVRTIGQWQPDYLFADFEKCHAAIRSAVALAERSILLPEESYVANLLLN